MTAKANYQLVHRHIEKIMPLLERAPGKAIPCPFLVPTHGQFYPGAVYCWDNHHMAMRFAYAGEPEYFKYLIETLLHYQSSDGFTPNCVDRENGPNHYFPKFHAQPFLMQGALMYLSQTRDVNWIKDRFSKARKYLEYHENNHRTHLGLFRWPVPWMGGIDNDVATTFFLPDSVITADINAWMYLEYRSAAVLAGCLGMPTEAKRFREKSRKLCQAINEILWYDKMTSYAAYNLSSGRHQFHLGLGTENEDSGYYAFQTCSNLIPLYAGIPQTKQAVGMIKKYVLSEAHFLSTYGIRSLSKSSPYYNNAVWGNPPRFGEHHRMTNSNWQGPVWIPLCYFMFHALLAYGFRKEALNIANRTINLLALSLKRRGSFTENYNAETGEPLFATEFASWNILADMMHQEMGRNRWIMEPVFER